MIYWTFKSGVPRPESNGQHYHCEECGAFLGNNLPRKCDCGNNTKLIDGGWIENQHNHPNPTLLAEMEGSAIAGLKKGSKNKKGEKK